MNCRCGQPLIRGIGCVAHGEPREAPTSAPKVKARAHDHWTEWQMATALRMQGDFSSAEIGAVIGKSEKAVKHWWSRKQLRKPRPPLKPRKVREAGVVGPLIRHRHPWSEEEIEGLDNGDMKLLQRYRSSLACRLKAHREGLCIYQDGYLSVREASREYAITDMRLLRMIRGGTLPAHRKGKLWRIDPVDAERVLSALSPARPFQKKGAR